MTSLNKIWVALIVVAIIAIGGYSYPSSLIQGGESLGASTPGTRFPHGITIGLPTSSPTNVSLILAGTCNFVGMDVSQTATTTSSYDCAVPGIIAGDIIQLQPATTTPTTNLGWRVNGANASSTAGFITAAWMNLTGGNAIPSVSKVGSSTQYYVFRVQ